MRFEPSLPSHLPPPYRDARSCALVARGGSDHGKLGAVPLVFLDDLLRIVCLGLAASPDALTGPCVAHVVGEKDGVVVVEMLAEPRQVVDAEADVGVGAAQYVPLVRDAHLLRELAGHDGLDLHDTDGPGIRHDIVAEVALGIDDGEDKPVIDAVTAGGIVDGPRHLAEFLVGDTGLFFLQVILDQIDGAFFFPVHIENGPVRFLG